MFVIKQGFDNYSKLYSHQKTNKTSNPQNPTFLSYKNGLASTLLMSCSVSLSSAIESTIVG